MASINVSKEVIVKYLKKIKRFMKKNYFEFFKNEPLILFFVFSVLFNTLLLRIITVKNGLYFKPLFIDMFLIFIIASFSFLFKTDIGKRRYIIGFSLFLTALCIVHSIYYTYYDSFASVSLLATSTFVVDVGDAVVKKVIKYQDFLYLWQVVFILYVVYHLKKKGIESKNTKRNRKNGFLNLFVTGVVGLALMACFMTPVEWSRFGKMWNRESVAASFGILVYQINDVAQSLEPKINNLFGHDKALKEVVDFYEEHKSVADKNDYSDIFKGKNVLVIHAESLQTIAINKSFEGKEVTPFLNKIVKESLYFDNFYSQVGVGTSSDAEFTFGTSLMPSNSGTVFVNYFDRKYNTIQKSFKNNGYYVFSMHANTGDFWNRATMHENMGYDKFYSKSSFDIDETIGLGLSDKSFFKQAVPMIKNIRDKKKKPFFGTLITLTNHTPWSDLELFDEFPTTWTVDINGQKVTRDYINGTTLGDYFRSVHYSDQSLEQLFGDLEKEGILDDTVVVIYGDHDARISKKYYNILNNYDPYTDEVRVEGDDKYIDYNGFKYDLDRKVPFIIWSKDGKYKKKISNVAGMIDVSPTLSNLFGLDNNKYSLGHDLFSSKAKDNVVVFTDGSYVTNEAYYDGQSGEVYSIKGDAYSGDRIKENSLYADDIIKISNNIITYDLIKELEGIDEKNKS
ncbi:MAG: LTA synthase family protein [Bacilli bacterium]|nr:LTA synthase family protein [Bacilli bacterium]